MSTYQQIIPISSKIIEKYDLCHYCLGRLFSKQLRLSSNKLLGKKLNPKSVEKCHVCKNLFANLSYFLKLMIDASSEHSFKTFNVGAMLKPSVIDRDDSIRSQYKLKGIDSIKTDVTKELGKLYSKKTKKIIDSVDPEITFTLNLKDESCQLRSKSITVYGRYVKSERGLSQKQKPCENCSGKGCRMCDFHGIAEFDSIEGVLSKLFFKKFGGTTVKFTWIGGEDKSSLVLGSGRPFFAKIQNPLKRNSKLSAISLDSVKLICLKLVHESPKRPIKFISSINMKISTNSEVTSKDLKKLKDLTIGPVTVYDKSGKRSEKKIFEIKYKKNSKNMFTLFVRTEGGLPLKRFVTGDDVAPGVSQILDVECICEEFDFIDIEV